jgi:hypothetical protein
MGLGTKWPISTPFGHVWSQVFGESKKRIIEIFMTRMANCDSGRVVQGVEGVNHADN